MGLTELAPSRITSPTSSTTEGGLVVSQSLPSFSRDREFTDLRRVRFIDAVDEDQGYPILRYLPHSSQPVMFGIPRGDQPIYGGILRNMDRHNVALYALNKQMGGTDRIKTYLRGYYEVHRRKDDHSRHVVIFEMHPEEKVKFGPHNLTPDEWGFFDPNSYLTEQNIQSIMAAAAADTLSIQYSRISTTTFEQNALQAERKARKRHSYYDHQSD